MYPRLGPRAARKRHTPVLDRSIGFVGSRGRNHNADVRARRAGMPRSRIRPTRDPTQVPALPLRANEQEPGRCRSTHPLGTSYERVASQRRTFLARGCGRLHRGGVGARARRQRAWRCRQRFAVPRVGASEVESASRYETGTSASPSAGARGAGDPPALNPIAGTLCPSCPRRSPRPGLCERSQ
jgi:hypothetical protein